MVMNYLFKYDKNESLKRNKMLMGLVVNKLLLAYKNKPNFLENIVLNAKPSLLSILNFIRKEASEKGYATPDILNKMQEQPQLNIDFKNTTSVEGFDGGKLFGQAVVIRKVSKFLMGSDEDMLMPIPVFYDLESKKILVDSLPKDIRDEYKD